MESLQTVCDSCYKLKGYCLPAKKFLLNKAQKRASQNGNPVFQKYCNLHNCTKARNYIYFDNSNTDHVCIHGLIQILELIIPNNDYIEEHNRRNPSIYVISNEKIKKIINTLGEIADFPKNYYSWTNGIRGLASTEEIKRKISHFIDSCEKNIFC